MTLRQSLAFATLILLVIVHHWNWQADLGASAAPIGAFVAPPSSPQTVSTKGFNPLAKGN